MRSKFLRKIHDYEKQYWEHQATQNEETLMEKICHGFTKKEFEEKKQSIIFSIPIIFKKTDTVLDLGCGIGRTCRWVAPQVYRYIGIDYVKTMIEKAELYNWDLLLQLAENHSSRHAFLTGNGINLDVLSDNYIDIAYSEIAFQHMPKSVQQSYIDDLKRVLKRDGLFYVQLPRSEKYNSAVSWNKDELDNLFNMDYEILSTSNFYYIIKAVNK